MTTTPRLGQRHRRYGGGPVDRGDQEPETDKRFYRFDRITYTIELTNEGSQPVSLTCRRDDQYGNVNGRPTAGSRR